jgi:transposase
MRAKMKLDDCHYQQIADCFPRQRGNVSMNNLSILNAILYVAENGCKWRSLPVIYGNWHTVYTRMNRWAKSGVLNRIFAALQQRQILSIKIDVLSLDSTSVKVHPDGTGALKKPVHNPSGCLAEVVTPKFIWWLLSKVEALPQVIGLQ